MNEIIKEVIIISDNPEDYFNSCIQRLLFIASTQKKKRKKRKVTQINLKKKEDQKDKKQVN